MNARPNVLFSVLAAMAVPAGAADRSPLAEFAVARIQNDAVVEASGLSCHDAGKGRIWVLNDGGSEPVVYAVSLDGKDATSVRTTAPNVDWEDMAVIRAGETTNIVIGDIGDNSGSRESVALYQLNERTGTVGELRFVYPNGPRDAEALVIDPHDQAAYVLSKRTLPAELYALPIDQWGEAETVTARFVGPVTTLPVPSAMDRLVAHARQSWHWQPTAMDIAPDGTLIAILTYAAVYLYARDADMTVGDALQTEPAVFDLRGLQHGESLCLTASDVLLTTEGARPTLYQIPLSDPGWMPHSASR